MSPKAIGWIASMAIGAMLTGCNLDEAGLPDDVLNHQGRLNQQRPELSPLELPPGLAADLPPLTPPSNVKKVP